MNNCIQVKSYSIREITEILQCEQSDIRSYLHVVEDEYMKVEALKGRTLGQAKEYWSETFKAKYMPEYNAFVIKPEVVITMSGGHLMLVNSVVAGDTIAHCVVDKSKHPIQLWEAIFKVAKHDKTFWEMILNQDEDLLEFITEEIRGDLTYNDFDRYVVYNPLVTYISEINEGSVKCINGAAIAVSWATSCQVIVGTIPDKNLLFDVSGVDCGLKEDDITFIALFLCGVGYDTGVLRMLKGASNINWLPVKFTKVLE